MSDDFNARLKRELASNLIDNMLSEMPEEMAGLRAEAEALYECLGHDAAEAWLQGKFNEHQARTGGLTRYEDGILVMCTRDHFAENTALCGSARMPIRETFTADPGSIRPVRESNGKRRFKAKVFHADRVNGNNRLYSRELMQRNLNRITPRLADGVLGGAIDHIGGFSGGNLGDMAIIWRDLAIESDGAGVGQFEVIEKHSKGADLLAQLDSGLSVGFSLLGFGSARVPTDAECKKYNIGDNAFAVIMQDDYELKQIDAVSDPACEDARLLASM